MSETRTAELLAQASRFLRENAARIQVQRYPNSWSTYQQAMVDCAIGLDALRAPQGPGTCATCCHWGGRDGRPATQRGQCYANESDEAMFADETLWTLGHFGCTLHEPLPPVPSSGSGEGR